MIIKKGLFINLFCLLIIAINISLLLLWASMRLTLVGVYLPFWVDIVTIVAVVMSFPGRELKVGKIVAKTVIVTLMVLKILIFLFFNFGIAEYHYSLPHSKETLIINESSFLFSSNIDVYRKVGGIFKKRVPLAHITADDGYLPFTAGEYRINWDYNDQLITYTSVERGRPVWKTSFSLSGKGRQVDDRVTGVRVSLSKAYSLELDGLELALTLKGYIDGRVMADFTLKNSTASEITFYPEELSFNYKNSYYQAYLTTLDSHVDRQGHITVPPNSSRDYTLFFAYNNREFPFRKVDLDLFRVLYSKR